MIYTKKKRKLFTKENYEDFGLNCMKLIDASHEEEKDLKKLKMWHELIGRAIQYIEKNHK
tara:strand:+ start:1466 stop:1645 length:180 start_codon:yes stop_codon:yes gene_type:complete